MIQAFICECGNDLFEIITENTHLTNNEDKTYYRCSECDKDHELNKVNFKAVDKIQDLFNEVLDSYVYAEEMVIDERGGDLNSLEQEKEQYKKEFEELIEKIKSLK